MKCFQAVEEGGKYILVLGTLYCQFRCSNVVLLSRTQNRTGIILQRLEVYKFHVKFIAIHNKREVNSFLTLCHSMFIRLKTLQTRFRNNGALEIKLCKNQR